MNTPMKFIVVLIISSFFITSCGPKAMRGGPETGNTRLDQKALSTKLDRMDIEYLVEENRKALFKSPFWKQTIEISQKEPIIAILPIENNTSEHIDDEMAILLSSIETSLVNSGKVRVVSRERQQQMIAELGLQQGAAFDSSTAGSLGRQLGAAFYITGKLGAVTERQKKMRRVQYNLFIQLIEVETSMVRFQNEAVRSKALRQ